MTTCRCELLREENSNEAETTMFVCFSQHSSVTELVGSPSL